MRERLCGDGDDRVGPNGRVSHEGGFGLVSGV